MLQRLWATAPLLLALSTLLWAGNFVLGRAVVDHIQPIALAFGRWVPAFLIVLGLAWRHVQRDAPLLRAHAGQLALLAFPRSTRWSTTACTAPRSPTRC